MLVGSDGKETPHLTGVLDIETRFSTALLMTHLQAFLTLTFT